MTPESWGVSSLCLEYDIPVRGTISTMVAGVLSVPMSGILGALSRDPSTTHRPSGRLQVSLSEVLAL